VILLKTLSMHLKCFVTGLFQCCILLKKHVQLKTKISAEWSGIQAFTMLKTVLLAIVVGLLAYSKLFLCDTFSLSAKS